MKKSLNKIYVIVPSAGIGTRFESEVPKQYAEINGVSILEKTINHFLNLEIFEKIIIPISTEDNFFEKLSVSKHKKIIKVNGGSTRSESVMSALEYIKENSLVVVHDAVRPCIRKEDINKLIEEVADDKVGGILANRIVDTVKQKNNGGLVSTIDRQKLYIAQTPQMFRYAILKDSIEKAIESNVHITDESEALESLNYSIRIVEGSSSNIKITTQEDIQLANYFLKHHEY